MHQTSLIALLERRDRLRIVEPHAQLIQITDARGQGLARVLVREHITLDQLDQQIANLGAELASCDADLVRYTREQAEAPRRQDRDAWGTLIGYGLQARQHLYAEQQRLQALQAEAERELAA